MPPKSPKDDPRDFKGTPGRPRRAPRLRATPPRSTTAPRRLQERPERRALKLLVDASSSRRFPKPPGRAR
eukprot:7809933-Pyramimonas_sp.AAC.1